jgi:hypothetical protein
LRVEYINNVNSKYDGVNDMAVKLNKVHLFRKGQLVGLVSQDFHYPEERKTFFFWNKIGLENI